MPHLYDLEYACLAHSPCYLQLKAFVVTSVQEMNSSDFGLHTNLMVSTLFQEDQQCKYQTKPNHYNLYQLTTVIIKPFFMDSPQHKPMRKRFAFAKAIVFAVLIIIPLNGLIPSTAVAQQQGINSNTSSSQRTNSFSSNRCHPQYSALDSW